MKLLEAQNSNPNDNKKGEKGESLRKPQDDQNTEVQAQTAGPSNPNSEAVVKPPNRKRMSTQTQRHQEMKRQKLSAKERKREKKASMIKEQQNQEKELPELRENTKKITEVVKAGNLKEVVESSREHDSTLVT